MEVKEVFCFVSEKRKQPDRNLQSVFELLYCKKVKYLYMFENGEKYTEIYFFFRADWFYSLAGYREIKAS